MAGAAGGGSPSLRRFFIAVLLIVSAAAAVQAQSLQSVLNKARFTAGERAAIEKQFQDAEAQGIPPGLLLPRLEEGTAKKVPAPRLLDALRREVERLLQARTLLEGFASGPRLLADPAAWARTANLLAGGLSAEEVRELAALCAERPETFRPASALYVSLRQWGLDRSEAAALLRGLQAAGFPGDSFAGIMEILIKGRAQRVPPGALVGRLLEALPRTQDLDELERRVLE